MKPAAATQRPSTATRTFAVVVTSYNHGAYVREAVDSALNQTLPPSQIIVVDDGSSDDSVERLRTYGSAIELIERPNGGQAAAFNTAFSAVRTDWVCLLDADDVWDPSHIADLEAAILPETALAYSRFRFLGDREHVRAQPARLLEGDLTARVLKSGGWWPFPPTSALALSSEAIRKIGHIPEDGFRICADAYLADTAPFVGRVSATPMPSTQYRLHGANNWIALGGPGEASRLLGKQIAQYEQRVHHLNEFLTRIGVESQVTLEDHWPYQRTKWLAGQSKLSHWDVCRRALGFRGIPAFGARGKSLVDAARTKYSIRRASV